MSTSSINSDKGVYPEQIQNSHERFQIEQARVKPFPEREDTITPLTNETPPLEGWNLFVKGVKIFFYYLFFPITYPCQLLCELLLRFTVFPMSLHTTEFGRWILRTFADTDIDMDRINEGKKSLEVMGGEAIKVKTADNQEIEVVRVTQEGFKDKVAKMGGHFFEYRVTLDEENAKHYFASGSSAKTHTLTTIDPNGNKDLEKAFTKMGWQQVDVETHAGKKTVFQFSLRLGTDPVKEGERNVVLRCHPNVHYYSFERKYLINHLAMGQDVVFYDTRGLSRTEFSASEEGLYLDADAVYNHMRHSFGYEGKNIWVTSRCSGSTQATYLRHRYLDEKVNIVYETPFEKYEHIVAYQAWPISSMALSVMDSVKTSDELTKQKAKELKIDYYADQFDNIRKLQSMPRKALDGSRVIVISTDTDRLIGEGPAEKVAKLSARTAATYHLKHRGTDPTKDGHFEDVFLHDAQLYAAYTEIMTRGRAQYLSNFR